MMISFFNEDGTLTPMGENLLLHFKGAIDMLFGTHECQDLTAAELRILQSNMISMVNERFSRRQTYKLRVATILDEMTDQEFEKYLEEKYGSIWKVIGLGYLTEEESNRVPLTIKAGLKKD